MKSKDLDKFYTKQNIAERCMKYVYKNLPLLGYEEVKFFEPSAGDGSFVKAIENTSHYFQGKIFLDTISCDIDPLSVATKQCDYLNTNKTHFGIEDKNNIVVVGNPPFGKRSKKAIEFVNKSIEYADTIAFIVPLQFKKWLVQNKLDKNLKLIFDKDLPPISFVYENSEVEIRTCFQIWTLRRHKAKKNLRVEKRPPIVHPDFQMFLHNNTKETLKYFDKKYYKWNFAVPRQGYYNYKLRITNPAYLKENIQWMFFKTRSKEIYTRVNSLDYEKLSFRNTTIPGYGKADVVQEYTSIYA